MCRFCNKTIEDVYQWWNENVNSSGLLSSQLCLTSLVRLEKYLMYKLQKRKKHKDKEEEFLDD